MMKRRDVLSATALTVGAVQTGVLSSDGPGVRSATAAGRANARPPIRETMRHHDEPRSGVMLGGIGAGGAELRKDGRFYNWTAFNNEPRLGNPLLGRNVHQESILFFKLRYEVPGEEPRIKILQIEENTQVGNVEVHIYEFPWMSGVAEIKYSARFPYTDLEFTDPDMPVQVRLRAWSPFVPHDMEASSLPAMIFDFSIKNVGKKPADVMLLACGRNMVGYDFEKKLYAAEMSDGAGYRMFEATATGLPDKHGTAGTQAIASLSADSTSHLGWEHRHPYYEAVLRSKKLSDVNENPKRTRKDKSGKRWALEKTFNTIGHSTNLASGKSFDHSFVATWHFPHAWNDAHDKIVGNYYNRRFKSAADVARHVIRNKADLEKRTFGFLDAFYDSDLDTFVLDQINSQLNTFRTSAVLSEEGHLGIIEGLTEVQKWGPVETTDVSVYGSIPLAILFPENLRKTLQAHQAMQHKNGVINHGLRRDFTAEKMIFGAQEKIRLDLHPQHVGMVLRDFFWSNDREYLKSTWESCKAAMEYCVRERDLNNDGMPDMEGIMSSYDNFPMFGTAAYIGSQWLAALAGMVQAAKALGDAPAERRYGDFFATSKKIFEDKLWNGKYYRLWNDEGGKHGGKDEGCLTDQIIGQWVTRFMGLPDLLDRERVKTALKSVLGMSYRKKFGLRNCSWPGGEPWTDVPENIWVDQANTCWSGVELAFASFLMYEGLYKEGVDVIRTVDDRYRKAGRYFDHQEFGGHYYRPMAVFGVLHALLGLSVNQGVMTFDPRFPGKKMRLFFAIPTGTGHYNRAGNTVTLEVATGKLEATALCLSFEKPGAKPKLVLDGKPIDATVTIEGKIVRFVTAQPLHIRAGQKLEARA